MKEHPTYTEVEKAIKSAGKFEKTIAYGMPAFRYKTKIVACYVECKAHIGYYPYSSNIVKHFKKELKGLKTSLGAVQFPKGEKVPASLIKKMVQLRIKEIEKVLAKKKK